MTVIQPLIELLVRWLDRAAIYVLIGSAIGIGCLCVLGAFLPEAEEDRDMP